MAAIQAVFDTMEDITPTPSPTGTLDQSTNTASKTSNAPATFFSLPFLIQQQTLGLAIEPLQQWTSKSTPVIRLKRAIVKVRHGLACDAFDIKFLLKAYFMHQTPNLYVWYDNKTGRMEIFDTHENTFQQHLLIDSNVLSLHIKCEPCDDSIGQLLRNIVSRCPKLERLTLAWVRTTAGVTNPWTPAMQQCAIQPLRQVVVTRGKGLRVDFSVRDFRAGQCDLLKDGEVLVASEDENRKERVRRWQQLRQEATRARLMGGPKAVYHDGPALTLAALKKRKRAKASTRRIERLKKGTEAGEQAIGAAEESLKLEMEEQLGT